LEQQRQELPFRESQKQLARQPEQQPWLPPLQHRACARTRRVPSGRACVPRRRERTCLDFGRLVAQAKAVPERREQQAPPGSAAGAHAPLSTRGRKYGDVLRQDKDPSTSLGMTSMRLSFRAERSGVEESHAWPNTSPHLRSGPRRLVRRSSLHVTAQDASRDGGSRWTTTATTTEAPAKPLCGSPQVRYLVF
jgi:hypothetical protein